MAIKGKWIEYGNEKGYFAAPERAGEPLPAIIVIQEAWGVNEHIEDLTRRLAAAGYAALAPDLFAENGERPAPLMPERVKKAVGFLRKLPPHAMGDPELRQRELAKLPEKDAQEIGETFDRLFAGLGRVEAFIPKLRESVLHLRTEREETKNQKVACVGFCMGGGLSALLACEEPDLSGAAVFYGMTPPAEKIGSIGCPVISFYGGRDQRVNAGIPLFEETMEKGGKEYEKYIYDDANHSFFNDDGPSYNVRAVRDSFVRLLTFFRQNLSD